MKKSWCLVDKILAGEKTVESRWYKNKSRPWNQVRAGDMMYFKNSGEPVSAKATVTKVKQYENLTRANIKELLAKYGESDLGTKDIKQEIRDYVSGKKYAIFVHFKNPEKIKPFQIHKEVFGNMSAWLCVEDIGKLEKNDF